MKIFDILVHDKTSLISKCKDQRKAENRMKKDVTPSTISTESLNISLAGQLGFCDGMVNRTLVSTETQEMADYFNFGVALKSLEFSTYKL